ncbi:MAG: phosphate-starvation-inducible PsiE family protein [Pseudomonadota bacterium]
MANEDPRSKHVASRLFHTFEILITRGLVLIISILILSAFWGLVVETYHVVWEGALRTFDHKSFQSAFGIIMTLLIAIELNRTLLHMTEQTNRVIIVKTVILVAILAVSRQFIVFEMESSSAITLAALAFALLTLGAVYRLMERPRPTDRYPNK